jgi:hypothetical protein
LIIGLRQSRAPRGWRTLAALVAVVLTCGFGVAFYLAFHRDVAVIPLDPPAEQPAVHAVPEREAPIMREPKREDPRIAYEARREKALRTMFQNDTPSAGVRVPEGSRRIDELVRAGLAAKGIRPAPLCSDAVFVRRVYVDVIGRIPTAGEAKQFLESRDPNRRAALIESLLTHRDFGDYWAMRWCDLLRVKSEFPINLWPNAVQAYHHWIRTAMQENLPYDRFVRTLLTASGSNFRDPPANFYRAVQKKDAATISRAVALTFLGVRPEGWPKETWAGVEPFFARVGYKKTGEWKEEVVFFDAARPLPGTPVFPDGTPATIGPNQDPRAVFADWLITPQNAYFTRTISNRAWAWLFGRGIIDPPDDIRADNPPSNPELLTFLEEELVRARYDLRHLFRVILNSATYQASSIPASDHPEAAALFAFYPVRRLDAEVLIDAICQVTGTTERYSSPIPEPFTYIPEGQRSVSLADASITSPFLEMFGRSARDTGLVSERNNNFTTAQRLHLLNSAHIRKKIEDGPALRKILRSGGKPEAVADQLYLTILSRYPTDDEREAAIGYGSGEGSGTPGPDVAWALINSAEFLCRH